MEFIQIQCCPVPTADHMDKVIAELLAEADAILESCYRGEDPHAQKFLTGAAPCFKHNQAYLYATLPAGVANPPYHSTHELYNDGVAYPVPSGTKLEAWQVGMDIRVERIEAFMAAARKRGYVITVTYPGSAVEAHHLNFRHLPDYVPPFDAIHFGEHDKRVIHLTKRLHYIHRSHGGSYLERPVHKAWVPYGTFDKRVEDAVALFQHDHRLGQDGVVGIHTFEQIETTFRRQYKARHRHHRDAPKHQRVNLHNRRDLAVRPRGQHQ